MEIEQVDKTSRGKRVFRAVYYWVLLWVLLTIADDATFGWIFWTIAGFSAWVSAVFAFVSYWLIGYKLVDYGMRDTKPKWADKLLERLMLNRKNPELAQREQQLKDHVTGVVVGLFASLLIGGVVTSLLLYRRGVSRQQVLRYAAVATAIYALEFALIHGLGLGGSVLGPHINDALTWVWQHALG